MVKKYFKTLLDICGRTDMSFDKVEFVLNSFRKNSAVHLSKIVYLSYLLIFL